jgi:TM2 domain-containing membrane protein YozV
MRYDANKKNLIVAYLLWIFVGWLGIHRNYLGKTGTGIAQLALWLGCTVLTVLTLGIGYVLFLIPALWLLIDAFLIPGITRNFNNNLIDRIAQQAD